MSLQSATPYVSCNHYKMRILFLTFIYFIIGCKSNESDQKYTLSLTSQTSLLDSLRKESSVATIIFHSQTSKLSCITARIENVKELDSIFRFLGKEKSMPHGCDSPGRFNGYGQISLFTDSTLRKGTADLHFILEGKCKGFYVDTRTSLKFYELTRQGEIALKSVNPWKLKTIDQK